MAERRDTGGAGARAATIQRRQHETALEDNGFWLDVIGIYARLGIPLDKIPAPYGDRRLTPEELRDAAQRYLPNDVYVHMTAMPKDSTLAVKTDSTAKTDSTTAPPTHLSTRRAAPSRGSLPH